MLRKVAAAMLLTAVAVLGLLLYPQPLFAFSVSHGQFRVWSDRPIDPAMMGPVLDDAARRLRTSELYDARDELRIFICNEPWRLALFARSTQVGGSADPLLGRNIYLREADLASNRIVPPSGTLADADVRPLSYFIAHEATHVMQSRSFGRLMELRRPDWLIEGYADWVAKGGAFDFDDNLRLLVQGDPRLDPRQSGLYRFYHLMVADLIERRGIGVRALFADPPAEEAVVRALRATVRQRPSLNGPDAERSSR